MELLLPATTLTGIDRIQHADALTLLRSMATDSVDITVTSPPYNVRWYHKTDGSHGMFKGSSWVESFKHGYESYSDDMPEPQYQAWVQQIVRECMRVSRGIVWVNHKTRFRDGFAIHPRDFLPYPMWSEIVWNRKSSMVFNARKFAPSHEFVLGFGRPHYWNDELNTRFTVWDIPFESTPDHPAPFPERLIEPLIMASCPVGGVVFDPFMGRGTTAVVAQRTGRHYIGCDISQKYVEMARKRLAQPYTLPMFLQEATA